MITARRLRFRYLLSDFVALNIGWLLFNIVRFYFLPSEVREGLTLFSQLGSSNVLLGQLVFPVMTMILMAVWGGYQGIYFRSRIDEIARIGAVTFVTSVIIFFIALFNDTPPERLLNFEIIAILWLLLFVPLTIERMWIGTTVARKIRMGEISFKTLVVGISKSSIALANKIESSGRGGFRIAGFVDTRDDSTSVREDTDLPVYNMKELPEICERENIQRIIVMPSRNGLRDSGSLINKIFSLNTRIYITPDLYSLIALRPRMDDIAGEMLVEITHTKTSRFTLNMKRISDVVLSALTLVVLSPIYLAIAIAVKRDSPGPVFYTQERIGRHKRPFRIYKFRSMYTHAEENGPALSTLDDQRITKVGAFLRKYRLDELPQFWNVLKGDMSIVGPRPERDFYIRQIVEKAPYYSLLHQVRPGITSWGMVKFGYASTIDEMIERLRYDLVYLDNVSLSVDLKILFHTVNTVLTGKGI